MNKPMSIAAAIAALVLITGASPAMAQAAPGSSAFFVDVNVGGQAPSRTLQTSTTFPLYNENAVVNAAQNIGAGPIFDISGGYKLTPSFGVAIGFTTFGRTGDGNLIASIPNPIVFGQPQVVTVSGSNLKRHEFATHLMAVFFIPIDDKFDATIFGGPSFIHTTQDVLSADVDPVTQVASVATVKQSGTATGGNIGVTGNYMFNRRYGAGIFLRYAGGSVDLPSASGAAVGGFQYGVGLRVRF
jgi:hypothetical protein